MKYLLYIDWPNTSKNHAGIKYLCKYLAEHYPKEFVAIPLAPLSHTKRRKLWKVFRGLLYILENSINVHRRKGVLRQQAVELNKRLTASDEVMLMEYMHPEVDQREVALRLRQLHTPAKIIGMAHMPPVFMDENFPGFTELHVWTDLCDKIITLGSSLTTYFINRGIAPDKLITTFHYVDDYYLNNDICPHSHLTVIEQGFNARNYELLRAVIEHNPNVYFVICQGVANLSSLKKYSNVRVVPFIPEEELRVLMSEADVSLNIMNDTIGSNVIVTSLAMGLAMVCSNVGSIHDYCDDSNTLFCRSLADFNSALQRLESDPDLVYRMRKSARQKAEQLRLLCFYTSFRSL